MKEITRYLKDVATLECQLYTQNRLLNLIKNRVSKLGYFQRYEKPIWYPWKFELFGDVSIFIYIMTFVGKMLFGFFTDFGEALGYRIDMDTLLQVLNILFWAPAKLTCTVALVEILLRNIHNHIKHNTKYRKLYNDQLAAYNDAVKADQARVQRELAVKQELEAQMRTVMKEKSATEVARDALYAVGIIPPKYRELVPVCAFYDYFETGRCLVMRGPGGAIDTYAFEAHLGRIETKLDVIISKLDEIIANQQYIGSLMRDANSTLGRIEQQNNRMAKSMSRLEENTELIKYNTRCSAQSAAIMEHIMVYQALKYD